MSDHTEKRIAVVQLIQALKEPDEKPGSVILRALRALKALPETEQIRDEWCEEYVRLRAQYPLKIHANGIDREELIAAGLNALSDKYPNDLIFANAGFAIGVVRTILDAVCPK